MTTEMQIPAQNVRFDLSCFYTGLDDPALDQDIERWSDAARAFERRFRGQLHHQLAEAIREYGELKSLSAKFLTYLSLRSNVDTGDDAVKAKKAVVEDVVNRVAGDHLEFFDHELAELDDTAIEIQTSSSPLLAKHLPWVREICRSKPYFLPEEVEVALVKRASYGSELWAEFRDEVEADLRFSWRGEQKTLIEMLALLNDHPDSDVREAALRVFNNGLSGYFAKYVAQNLFVTVRDVAVETRERGYAHPMDSRNQSNNLPDAVVEALHRAVTEHGGQLARRYYALKAKILGKSALAWSDRNAPMPFADERAVPWEKAMEVVLAAYRSFSPTLAELIEQTAARGHIDAAVTPGKYNGAFNSPAVLPNGTPVALTFLNYQGTMGDVTTLAHELGHGVHFLLAGASQGPLMQETSIVLCETASVFGEMLTFAHLKEELLKTGKQQEVLALLMRKLDDMMNTVVRQIGFSNFERRLHGWNQATGVWEESRRLPMPELIDIWHESLYELYGKPGEVFTYRDTDYLWTYIPHFHDPFYVYGYAGAEIFVQSLFAARSRLGERFEPMYLDLLRAGGSKNITELLQPFGLDPSSSAFWSDGLMASMGALVDEAEVMAKELGFVK